MNTVRRYCSIKQSLVKRAYSIAVEHLHGMEGVGVRLPVGPPSIKTRCMSKESMSKSNGNAEGGTIHNLSKKEIKEIKEVVSAEGVAVEENEEYFVIHLAHKDHYIPKREVIPLLKEDGMVENVGPQEIAQAIARFPTDSPLDAIKKFRKEKRQK